MDSKLSVEDVDGKVACPVEEGGEIVFDKSPKSRDAAWDIQSPDPSATVNIVFGGEVGSETSKSTVEKNNQNTVWSDTVLRRAAGLTVMAGVLVIVITVCVCVLMVVVNDIYRGTMTSKDLFPLISTFLQTAITILMGILVVGFKRRDGG